MEVLFILPRVKYPFCGRELKRDKGDRGGEGKREERRLAVGGWCGLVWGLM